MTAASRRLNRLRPSPSARPCVCVRARACGSDQAWARAGALQTDPLPQLSLSPPGPPLEINRYSLGRMPPDGCPTPTTGNDGQEENGRWHAQTVSGHVAGRSLRSPRVGSGASTLTGCNATLDADWLLAATRNAMAGPLLGDARCVFVGRCPPTRTAFGHCSTRLPPLRGTVGHSSKVCAGALDRSYAC